MNTDPFDTLEMFACKNELRENEEQTSTCHFLSELITRVSEQEIAGYLPTEFFDYIASVRNKFRQKALLQIEEHIEEIAENINACQGFYLDREDILKLKTSASTRGSKLSRGLFDLLDELLRNLHSHSITSTIRCDVKIADMDELEQFSGTAIILPMIAASDSRSREFLGVVVYLVRSDSLGTDQVRELERECTRIIPNAWLLNNLKDPQCLLPTICSHEGWSSIRHIRRLCKIYVQQCCPSQNDGHFSASLWYSDAPYEKAYVHSTYGFDYCFVRKPLPVASSGIGKTLVSDDEVIVRYAPDDESYLEKDKAKMAGVQSFHAVKVGSDTNEKMAFVCHCFDASWRDYSPELSTFRCFGNAIANLASAADRWKVAFALMDLDWRLNHAAGRSHEVLPIELISRVVRDRLAAYFESKGCTIFLAEEDGTELYPIATFGLREDRLRSHEGRLVPEREIVAYDLTQRGLLKLLVERPRFAVAINDVSEYRELVRMHPYLIKLKPRRELQENSLTSIDESRFLGVGLKFPKLNFVLRISRRASDPPFRHSDKLLLEEIAEFLEGNSHWKSAAQGLASTFSTSVTHYRLSYSSGNSSSEMDTDVLQEYFNGECG